MTGGAVFCSASRCAHDLEAEVGNQGTEKLPPVLPPSGGQECSDHGDEHARREAMLQLDRWLRMRAGEGGADAAGDIDSEQMIIRIRQSKGSRTGTCAAGGGPDVAAMVEGAADRV